MARQKTNDPKLEALKANGTLNPTPQKVTDEHFLNRSFFDPRDMIQVKYELLRRVRVDDIPVAQAVRQFGLSRNAFYQAQKAFNASGISGLLPEKRGPKHAHKLSSAVMDFIAQQKEENSGLKAAALVPLIKKEFGLSVHKRSIERALKKKALSTYDKCERSGKTNQDFDERYETFRAYALSNTHTSLAMNGIGKMCCHGLCAWIKDGIPDCDASQKFKPTASPASVEPFYGRIGIWIADLLIAAFQKESVA